VPTSRRKALFWLSARKSGHISTNTGQRRQVTLFF
jgi:hypothetical protein